jgi:tetratricopeptide (TPR) repeat protein
VKKQRTMPAAPPDSLFAQVFKLLDELPRALSAGDGTAGLKQAQAAENLLRDIEALLPLRQKALDSRTFAKTCRQFPELSKEYGPIADMLAQGDAATTEWKVDEARRHYDKATAQGRAAFARALAHFERILTAGDKAIQTRKFGDAKTIFEQLVMLGPQGSNPSPLPVEDGASRLGPILAHSYNGRAEAFLGLHDKDHSIVDCTEAIRLDPAYSRAYATRGYAWYAKKEFDKAIADCTEAIRLDPAYANAHSGRGYAWYGKKEYDKAIADSNEAIRLDPGNREAYTLRSDAYQRKQGQ